MSLWPFRRPSLPDGSLSHPEENQSGAIAAWLFLSPALLLLSVCVLGPIAYLVYLSFTAGSFTRTGTHWIGFSNYWRLFLNPDFWQVLGNTLYFTVATVIPSLVISLGLAVLLNRAF